MRPRTLRSRLRDLQDGCHWFAKRPRWHVHFTPTSASNQVKRFFGLLTEKQLRRGVNRSTADLEHHAYTVNDDPKPFRWTKDEILASIERFRRRTLETAQTQAI